MIHFVYQKDRLDRHGGVLIACSDKLPCSQIPLDTVCEVVACKVDIQGKSVILESVYRSSDHNLNYMENLAM